jgi:hypothetical protein
MVFTLTTAVSFAFIDTLFVYLPRVKPHERRAYICQTEAYLVLSAVIASVLFIACRMFLSEGLGRAAGWACGSCSSPCCGAGVRCWTGCPRWTSASAGRWTSP